MFLHDCCQYFPLPTQEVMYFLFLVSLLWIEEELSSLWEQWKNHSSPAKQKTTSYRNLNALNGRSKENDVSGEHDAFIGRWYQAYSDDCTKTRQGWNGKKAYDRN